MPHPSQAALWLLIADFNAVGTGRADRNADKSQLVNRYHPLNNLRVRLGLDTPGKVDGLELRRPPEAVMVLRARRSIRFRSWKKELRSDGVECADRQRSVRSESSALGRSDCSCLVSYYCSAVSSPVLLHGLPSWSGPHVVSLVRFLIRLPLVHPHSPHHRYQRLIGTQKVSLRCDVRTLGRPPRPWIGWRSPTISGRGWSLLLDRRLRHPPWAAGHFRFDHFRPRSLRFLKRAYLLRGTKPKTVKRTRRRIAAMDPIGGSPPQRAWRGHSPIHKEVRP